ncbi:hypothetical protein E4K72_17825 [Oxalobacteraceae bacterium OM1]|nr:hypothetical protein E4K72_17825 [Oxalobacteraceae bacterium OM1]
MESLPIHEQLAMADLYIEQGEWRLHIQEERIRLLRELGKSVEHEEHLVAIMRDLLETLRVHRALIARTIAGQADL